MGSMKSFTLVNPKTVEEAVQSLPSGRGIKDFDRARLLAGGQDILTEMKEHLVEPSALVNLKHVPGLDEIREVDGGFEIGALVTVQDIADDARLSGPYQVIAEAASQVGSAQIRAAGTLGGNLCQRPRCWYYRHEGAPCLKKGGAECFAYSGLNKYNAVLGGGPSYIVHPSDIAPALVALDARITLVGPDGEREMALDRFYTLPSEGNVMRENRLETNEIVTKITVPKADPAMKSTYVKFRERSSYDFALASVAMAYKSEGGKIRGVRIALGGVAPIPWRCLSAEKAVEGSDVGDAAFRAAGEEAMAEAEPLEHNGFKIPLTQGLIVQAGRKLA